MPRNNLQRKPRGGIYWIARNHYGQMIVFLTLKEAWKEGWAKEDLIKTKEVKS